MGHWLYKCPMEALSWSSPSMEHYMLRPSAIPSCQLLHWTRRDTTLTLELDISISLPHRGIGSVTYPAPKGACTKSYMCWTLPTPSSLCRSWSCIVVWATLLSKVLGNLSLAAQL